MSEMLEQTERRELAKAQREGVANWRCPTCGGREHPPTSSAAMARARWRVGEFDKNAQIVNQVVDIAEKLEARVADLEAQLDA